MSELWSSVILSLVFWGFTNQITRLGEAKRFYALFGVAGNFSGFIAGSVSAYLCSFEFNPLLPFGEDAWHQSMVILIILILICGVVSMGLIRWMNASILTDARFYDPLEHQKGDEVKGKLSMRENFAILFKSEYLLCIALIVLSYNIVINLSEVVWKHEVKELYPHPQDYNRYMNEVMIVTGVLATFTSMVVAGNSIRKFGWTFTAMLTPFILLLTSVGFFGFFFVKGDLINTVLSTLGASPLMLIVFFGSAQNIMSRAAKYTVFDATKEMAFVPLSPEAKLKGKAAIDGVCSRMGKSTGSVVLQILILTFSTIAASIPYIAISLFAIIALWMGATFALGRRFDELSASTTSNKQSVATASSEPLKV
jgi:AAA family ATP:ADP antiporter